MLRRSALARTKKPSPLRATVLGQHHHIIPARLAIDGKLAGKANPRDTPNKEYNKKLVRPESGGFEIPVYVPKATDAAQRDADYRDFEYKLIWAAFDVPERVPVLLRDRLVAGDREAFSDRWLDAAVHWVLECRYWRCIGVERPFYDEFQLRVHTWASNGTDVGNIQRSAAMIDALRDLERAVRREAEGLPAHYAWDSWGPWGNVDGSRSQVLPRFRANQVEDPDGIDVTVEDVSELTSIAKIKERFGSIIAPETEPFRGAFLNPTNGHVTFEDFGQDLQAKVAQLRGMSTEECAKLSSDDDIRTMLFLSGARSTFEELLGESESWDDVVDAVKPHRDKHDMMIDAARLQQLSRDVDELRLLYEEKCGFSDFHMTTDKVLTGATLAHLGDVKTVLSQDWGPELLRCTIDAERAQIMGDVGYGAYRELMDMDREKQRRRWTARFSGEANEEKTLDFMLQHFARRTDRPGGSNEPGEDFDREKEPIGRHVQRRVLESDVAVGKLSSAATSKSRLEKFSERVKSRKSASILADVKYNQFVASRQL